MKKIKRQYGWVPDLPDKRDEDYKLCYGIRDIKPFSNLEANNPPVEDQEAEGSCTAHGLTGVYEHLEIKKGIPANLVQLSRQFLYHNELRVAQPFWPLQDRGSQIRTGIKCLAKQGVCREELYPYVVGGFKKKPPAKCYTDALYHQIIEYTRLNTLDDLRVCLSEGFPFVFGFSVYESFESREVASTGIVPMPSATERLLGGHCVFCFGHNDAKRWFMCRNSWGSKWGRDGNFVIPYEYLSNRNLSDDFWKITKGE